MQPLDHTVVKVACWKRPKSLIRAMRTTTTGAAVGLTLLVHLSHTARNRGSVSSWQLQSQPIHHHQSPASGLFPSLLISNRLPLVTSRNIQRRDPVFFASTKTARTLHPTTSLFSHHVPGDEHVDHGDDGASSAKGGSGGRMTALLSRFRSRSDDSSDGAVAVAVAVADMLDEETVNRLQRENERLKDRLNALEEENQMLHYEVASRVVLETFEGEGKMRKFVELQKQREAEEAMTDDSLTWTGEELMSEYDMQQQQDAGMWCDELTEDDACPVEPLVSFSEALRDRAYWLVGLLVLQSLSGIILARNEALLANHPVIIYFLTMLVGAGGNAGNQASVRVIRGLALGTLNEQTQSQFLVRELKMAGALSGILSLSGFLRAAAFRTPFPETIAVTVALALIVFSSVCLGAILPLGLKKLRVDPAHSSTSIQVVMDILGVVLAIAVSGLLLDSPLGTLLISKLGG